MKKTNTEDLTTLLHESLLHINPAFNSFELSDATKLFEEAPLELIFSFGVFEFLFFVDISCEALLHFFSIKKTTAIQIFSNQNIPKTSREFLFEFLSQCPGFISTIAPKELQKSGFNSELISLKKFDNIPDTNFITKNLFADTEGTQTQKTKKHQKNKR